MSSWDSVDLISSHFILPHCCITPETGKELDTFLRGGDRIRKYRKEKKGINRGETGARGVKKEKKKEKPHSSLYLGTMILMGCLSDLRPFSMKSHGMRISALWRSLASEISISVRISACPKNRKEGGTQEP